MTIKLTEALSTVLQIGGFGIFLYLLLAYVGRTAWEHFLQLDFESHKADLKRLQDEVLADLRKSHEAELDRERAKADQLIRRWEQRYTRFHEKRFEALLDLHHSIVDMRAALEPLYGLLPHGVDQRAIALKAAEKYNDFQRKCRHTYIFMPDELVVHHEELMSMYLKLLSGFLDVPKEEMWKNAGAKWNTFMGDAKSLEATMRKRYQRELGAFEEIIQLETEGPVGLAHGSSDLTDLGSQIAEGAPDTGQEPQTGPAANETSD